MKQFQILTIGFVLAFFSVNIASANTLTHKKNKVHTHKAKVETNHVIVTRPSVGARVTVVNKSATVVVHNRKNYRYYNGVFYTPASSGFVVVKPPIGIVVVTMPPNVVIIRYRGRRYYHCGGAYFIQKGGKYHCVKSPY